MKTIIAGGRDYILTTEDWKFLSKFSITEVVCGGARGADEGGRTWAVSKDIPVKMFPALWSTHGKAAGMIRNKQMAEYGERLIAFWDGESRGTKNMIDTARKFKLDVIVVYTQ